MAYIMLLNDGETYTNLEGCKIVWIGEQEDPAPLRAAPLSYGMIPKQWDSS